MAASDAPRPAALQDPYHRVFAVDLRIAAVLSQADDAGKGLATVLPKLTLVLGGASSGKTGFAERLVLEHGQAPVYLASAQVYDDEMRAKVKAHRDSRSERWRTAECPMDIAKVLGTFDEGETVLFDCATLWLSNQQEQGADMAALTTSLVEALNNASGPVVLVSNEVGLGIVPANELARAFRDVAGRVNQAVARAASDVFFVASGLSLPLKTNGTPVGPEYS